MELTVMERMLLLQALQETAPKLSNVATMLVLRKLNKDVGFAEDELIARKITEHENGQISWSDGSPKEIELGPVAMEMIRKGLRTILPQLDKAELATMDHIFLFEKFDVDMTLPEAEAKVNED